jgi:hypothetical protein
MSVVKLKVSANKKHSVFRKFRKIMPQKPFLGLLTENE